MSVMERMRSGTDSTGMQIVFALIVVSFIFWFGTGSSTDKLGTAATVNGSFVLEDNAYRQSMRQATSVKEYMLAQDGQQRDLTDEERSQLRFDVVQRLTELEALSQQTETLGLFTGEHEVAFLIQNDRRHWNDKGEFSLELWERRLDREAMSQGDIESNYARQARIAKLRWLVGLTVNVTDTEVEKAYVDQYTTVDVRYVTIGATAVESTIDVTDDERQAWVAAHKADIERDYERAKGQLYDLPVRLRYSVISLMVDAEKGPTDRELEKTLQGVRAEIEAGADFATLARMWSEDGSAAQGGASATERRLPTLPTAVRDAVKDLQEGELSSVVRGDGRVALYLIDARQEAELTTLEQATDEIATRLMRKERAPEVARAFADEVLASWKSTGDAPFGLLIAKGLLAKNTGPLPLGALGMAEYSPNVDMTRAARDLPVHVVLPSVYETIAPDGGTQYTVGQVASRRDADMQQFIAEAPGIREQILLGKRLLLFDQYRGHVVAQADIQLR